MLPTRPTTIRPTTTAALNELQNYREVSIMPTTLFYGLQPDTDRDDDFTPLKKGNGAESTDDDDGDTDG